MAYTGSVDLISGIRPKNNGSFPLVDAKDVYVTDDKRLDAALDEKADAVDTIAKPAEEGTTGQILRIDEEGKPAWSNVGTPTEEQVGDAVDAWLTAHPEATTTVQDGTITRAKLDDDLKEKTDAVPELKSAIDQITSYTGGKNLFNFADMTPGYVNQANGKVVDSTSHGVSNFIPITADFTISANRSLTGAGLRICCYSGPTENDYIPGSGEQVPSSDESLDATLGRYYVVKHVPNNTAYIRFSTTAYTSQYAYDIQVEAGSVPTSYEAYTGKTYKIKYTSLPGALTEEITGIQNSISDIEDDILSAKGDIDDIENDVSNIQNSINAITEDEQETETVTETIQLVWTAGYVMLDGTEYSSSSTYQHSNKIDVNPGDIIKLYRETSGIVNQCRYITAYKNNTAVQAAGRENADIPYTVPDNVDQIVITILLSFGNATGDKTYETIASVPKIKESALPDALIANIDNIENDVSDIQDKIDEMMDIVEMLTFSTYAGYMSTTGDVVDSGPGTYGHTSKISVMPGDKIIAIPKANSKSSILRFVCAYNGETIVSASGATSVTEYTVPNGIDGIVVTGFCATTGDLSTIPNFFKFTKGTKPRKSLYNTWSAKGNLSTGETLILPINNISKNRVITFDAAVSTFSAIKFGRTTYNNAIQIDGTYVSILNNSGNVVGESVRHNITISNTISVRIVHDISASAGNIKIYVSSNGVNASVIEFPWSNPTSGSPKITSVGSTLTDCTFTYAPTDINKKIFGFGDSYFSMDSSRWIGQLKSAGYVNNLLTNAYSGESAVQNIPALFNIIPMGNPKYILWANGMNDGADSSEQEKPATQWTNAIQILLTLCKEYDVVPILCTIPTVPTINNEYKNAWIRASEYRYIDFAKAVGANSSGVWYTGMLSQDGVHPAEQGAIALYNRAIADFGELTQIS